MYVHHLSLIFVYCSVVVSSAHVSVSRPLLSIELLWTLVILTLTLTPAVTAAPRQ